MSFEPEVEWAKMRRGLLHEHRETFNNAYIFDGFANIKSTKLLDNLNEQNEREFFSTRRTDNAQIKITVKHVAEVSWGHPEMMRLYNTQMRRNLQHLKMLLIGRNYFDPNIRHKITSHRLEVWQGILTAINNHDGGNILMVCDTIHKVVRSDTVLEILQELINRDRSGFQDAARRQLGGSIVMTSYNNKTYRVDDIAFDKNPLHTFERKNGPEISIKQYYQDQYNIKIRDERQPLLIALPSARQQRAQQGEESRQILLVPELCSMTGLTESLRNDNDVKKQMTSMTQADPNQRIQNLDQFIQSLNSNPEVQREMRQWGISFERNPIEIPARKLDIEEILFKEEQKGQGVKDWSLKDGFGKNMRGKAFYGPVGIKDWCIICTKRNDSLCNEFSSTLNRVCRPMDIILNRPQVKTLDNDRVSTFVETCNSVPQKMQLAVIIVPNNNKDRYDAIKKIFCCDRPLASQVIVARTISNKKNLMTVCTKIGIQMGCKLGGEAWALDIPVRYKFEITFK